MENTAINTEANPTAENTEKNTVNHSPDTAPTQLANTAQEPPTQPRLVQIHSRPCSCNHNNPNWLEYAEFGLNLLATAALIFFIIKLLQFSKKLL